MAMTRRPAPGERSPESERGRVERPVRARKPRRHDLDHERDIGAARAAKSEKRAAKGGFWIRGRLPIAIHRPARGQRLASLRIVSELDKGGRAGRLVDQQRRPFVERRGEGDRVGAIDRRLGARDGHQRRAAGRGERDKTSLSETTRIIAELARGVAAVLREQRDPEGSRALAERIEGSVEARLRDPASRVAMDRRGGWRSHNRLGVADDPSRSQARPDSP